MSCLIPFLENIIKYGNIIKVIFFQFNYPIAKL